MTAPADPLETALLARLLVATRKAPSEADIVKSLRPLFAGNDAARVQNALARLERAGLRTADMKLTDAGRARVCDALGRTKPPTQWRAMKRLLAELALGFGASKKPLSASTLRAAALAKKLDLDAASTSPAAVLDAWAARELGMTGQKLTIANVRAFALSRALGIETLRDPKRISTVASAKVLGVARTDADSVRDAVLRDWLAAPTAAPAEPLMDFASAVKDVARTTSEDGRFGRFKVFIAPIWERARGAAPFARMTERDFKTRLIEAHRAGFLHLARADLTPAMARELVTASEVPYLNAVFHFVDLEGNPS